MGAGDRRQLLRAARRRAHRSEEHTSELQSLMRISYAVFCLKKKKKQLQTDIITKEVNIAYLPLHYQTHIKILQRTKVIIFYTYILSLITKYTRYVIIHHVVTLNQH